MGSSEIPSLTYYAGQRLEELNTMDKLTAPSALAKEFFNLYRSTVHLSEQKCLR